MRLGIASWSVPWAIGIEGYQPPVHPLTPIDLVGLARECGVGLLQIADNLPLHRLSSAELRNLRGAAENSGIELQTGARGVEPDRLLRYLAISTELGAKILRTVGHTPGGKPNIAQVADWMGQVLPHFEKAGVAIAFENNEAHSVEEFAWLVRRMDSPSLGVCLDTANSLGALEMTDRAVEELAPLTIVCHAKDFDIIRIDTRMGFSVVGRPAGQGRVNFAFIFGQLARCGRNPDIVLEHWPPFVDNIGKTIAMEREWLAESLRFLTVMLTKQENLH